MADVAKVYWRTRNGKLRGELHLRSLVAAMCFFDEALDLQVADNVFPCERADVRVTACRSFVHPIRVADVAAADRDEIELGVLKSAQ